MNNRKEYMKKWREEHNEHIKQYKKDYAKTHDSSFKKLQKENKRLYELCMYALISSTKIYNHELTIITKQAFIQIIKENLQEDTFAIRDKIKKYWETGDK